MNVNRRAVQFLVGRSLLLSERNCFHKIKSGPLLYKIDVKSTF